MEYETMSPRNWQRALLGTGLICAGLAGALMIGVASAQETTAEPKPESTETPGAAGNPWVVNCSSGQSVSALQCQISQNLTESKSGKRVLTVTIRRQAQGEQLAMLLALPHGLFLPAGASYQIDSGQKTTLAIQTSDQNGAYAAAPLTPELVAALKAGTKLNIGMESVTRKPVVIPVSLTGFTAAVETRQAVR